MYNFHSVLALVAAPTSRFQMTTAANHKRHSHPRATLCTTIRPRKPAPNCHARMARMTHTIICQPGFHWVRVAFLFYPHKAHGTRLEHDWGCCYLQAVQVTTAHSPDETEEGLMTVYVHAHVSRETEVPGTFRVIELLDEEGDDLMHYLDQASKLFTVSQLKEVLQKKFNTDVCIELISH